jgi:hypothetical protein
MRQDLKSRLLKAEIMEPAISWADRQAADHRRSLRALAAVCDLIRERLRLMGIDPELAVALQRGEKAAAELAAIPDSPDQKGADEAIVASDFSNEDDGASDVKAKIERIAERYRSGKHQLDLAKASPAELLAFCVAAETDAWDQASHRPARPEPTRSEYRC